MIFYSKLIIKEPRRRIMWPMVLLKDKELIIIPLCFFFW